MGTVPSTEHSEMNKYSPGSGGISRAAGSRNTEHAVPWQGHRDKWSSFQSEKSSLLTHDFYCFFLPCFLVFFSDYQLRGPTFLREVSPAKLMLIGLFWGTHCYQSVQGWPLSEAVLTRLLV